MREQFAEGLMCCRDTWFCGDPLCWVTSHLTSCSWSRILQKLCLQVAASPFCLIHIPTICLHVRLTCFSLLCCDNGFSQIRKILKSLLQYPFSKSCLSSATYQMSGLEKVKESLCPLLPHPENGNNNVYWESHPLGRAKPRIKCEVYSRVPGTWASPTLILSLHTAPEQLWGVGHRILQKFPVRKPCDFSPYISNPVQSPESKALFFYSDVPPSVPRAFLCRPLRTESSGIDIARMSSWCGWFEGCGRRYCGAMGRQVNILNLGLHPPNVFSPLSQSTLCLVPVLGCGYVELVPLRFQPLSPTLIGELL